MLSPRPKQQAYIGAVVRPLVMGDTCEFRRERDLMGKVLPISVVSLWVSILGAWRHREVWAFHGEGGAPVLASMAAQQTPGAPHPAFPASSSWVIALKGTRRLGVLGACTAKRDTWGNHLRNSRRSSPDLLTSPACLDGPEPCWPLAQPLWAQWNHWHGESDSNTDKMPLLQEASLL